VVETFTTSVLFCAYADEGMAIRTLALFFARASQIVSDGKLRRRAREWSRARIVFLRGVRNKCLVGAAARRNRTTSVVGQFAKSALVSI
jgi:hypothetical protein